jgi:hypothetical protein
MHLMSKTWPMKQVSAVSQVRLIKRKSCNITRSRGAVRRVRSSPFGTPRETLVALMGLNK